jgi:hypothetical protein
LFTQRLDTEPNVERTELHSQGEEFRIHLVSLPSMYSLLGHSLDKYHWAPRDQEFSKIKRIPFKSHPELKRKQINKGGGG